VTLKLQSIIIILFFIFRWIWNFESLFWFNLNIFYHFLYNIISDWRWI